MNRQVLESCVERPLAISADDIRAIVAGFHGEMKRGLAGRERCLKMLPAFVDKPSGKERGDYIALDFGGTNFRILRVRLDGKGNARILNASKFVIPKAVMHGAGTQLFNFIADSIRKFLARQGVDAGEGHKLGFTFSFPMRQTTIATGTLINWTKGFTAAGVVGKDVVGCLEEALRRCGLHGIDVVALANDTVGTMAAGSYKHANCDVGIIFGTGTNACYREKLSNIGKLPQTSRRTGHMVINIEWGNFDRLPFTLYDEHLDRSSSNPGEQRMEKMISGMYLGEVARLILSDLIRRRFLFATSGGTIPKGSFKTWHMSAIESDRTRELVGVKQHFDGIGILNTSMDELKLVRHVCRLVSTRAARISAAAISAVVTWMDPRVASEHAVAIDGTLYEKYPGFKKTIAATLEEIHGPQSKRIKLIAAKDGSGIGVAIVAAAAASQR